jgi:DNA-binding transcriptional regulator GbsR (MarR family)
MNEEENGFIEMMGRHMEQEGMPRIAGRLMAALMLNAEPSSLDDLTEQLQVSKASISSNARLLENYGIAERTSLAGDRRDFYCISDNMVERFLLRQIERNRAMLQRLEVGRSIARDERVVERFDTLTGFIGGALTYIEKAVACRGVSE